MLCFASSFVRLLQFLQSLRILILFNSRRIIMLETPIPYLSSSLVGHFVLHKVRWCLSIRPGTAYFHFLLLPCCPPLTCGASTEVVYLLPPSRPESDLCFIISPSPRCLIYYYPPDTYSVRIAREAMLVAFPPNRSSSSSWISSATRIRNQKPIHPSGPLSASI